MKVLVTGAAGFIGSNVALDLQKEYSVVGLDDCSVGVEENLCDFKGEFIKADIRTFDFAKLGRLDAILHQAAITDTTVTDKKLMFAVNVDAFARILKYAAESGCKKVVYASSAAVYGKGRIPMREDQPPTPANYYGESKARMDEVSASFVKEHPDISVVGLRYFNVYGPREGHKKSARSMIRQLHEQLVAGKRPRIFKWGEQFRDFIYVKDVVAANRAALKFAGSGVFNVGTGVPASFNQVVEILRRAMESSASTDYFDNPYSFYQEATQAQTDKAEQELGFKAKYQPEDGIRDYSRWLSRKQKQEN